MITYTTCHTVTNDQIRNLRRGLTPAMSVHDQLLYSICCVALTAEGDEGTDDEDTQSVLASEAIAMAADAPDHIVAAMTALGINPLSVNGDISAKRYLAGVINLRASDAASEAMEQRRNRRADRLADPVGEHDIVLTRAQARHLRWNDERQALDARVGAISASAHPADMEEREDALLAIEAIDTMRHHGAVMALIGELQRSLPSGAVLRWPDGSIARMASVDLSSPTGRDDRAAVEARIPTYAIVRDVRGYSVIRMTESASCEVDVGRPVGHPNERLGGHQIWVMAGDLMYESGRVHATLDEASQEIDAIRAEYADPAPGWGDRAVARARAEGVLPPTA